MQAGVRTLASSLEFLVAKVSGQGRAVLCCAAQGDSCDWLCMQLAAHSDSAERWLW